MLGQQLCSLCLVGGGRMSCAQGTQVGKPLTLEQELPLQLLLLLLLLGGRHLGCIDLMCELLLVGRTHKCSSSRVHQVLRPWATWRWSVRRASRRATGTPWGRCTRTTGRVPSSVRPGRGRGLPAGGHRHGHSCHLQPQQGIGGSEGEAVSGRVEPVVWG